MGFKMIEPITFIGTPSSRKWKCVCDCGKECFVTSSDLKRNHKKDCGKCELRILKSIMSPIKQLFNNYKRGAKNRKLQFELTLEEFHQITSKDCVYCKSPPMSIFQKRGGKMMYIYNGIDRADNKTGYIKENCFTCCKFCNFAKSSSNLDEFLSWIDRIKTNT